MRRTNLASGELESREAAPAGFNALRLRLGKELAPERTGASLYELPPGEAICPYHYELGKEEWLVVLEGRPTVRHPEGSDELGQWDVAFFPRGPEGAHQVGNRGDVPARVLMWSEVTYPSATSYPDSDKVGVWTGVKPEDLIVERSSGVDYYRGEG
jgi:uncharacterized cupin superfamily protein